MTRDVRNALLVFVGAVLILIVVDGTVLHYVRTGFTPLVVATGVVVIALALLDVVRDARGHPEPLDCAPAGGAGESSGDTSDDDGHSHQGRAAWLLLVPVLVVLLAAPPPLGSEAIDLAGGRTAPVGPASAEALPPGEAPDIGLGDLVARAAADPSGGVLAERDVTLTGFLVPARDQPGVDLARLTISCCAADASPVRVHLDDPDAVAGAPAAAGAGDRWVAVRVRLVPGTATRETGFVPTVRVVAARAVDEPSPAYEY